MVDIAKKANEKCKHQNHKGCAVYNTKQMPMSCRMWNCRWIINELPVGMRRPDRVHYVVDIMPDTAVMEDDNTKERKTVETVQIWVDPKYPNAHRDPGLRAWLSELGKRNIVGQVRYNSRDCIFLFPPSMSGYPVWVEKEGKLDPNAETMGDLKLAMHKTVLAILEGLEE